MPSEAIRRPPRECAQVLFAAVGDCHAAWARAAPGGDAPDLTADKELMADGASLLGSLIYSATPFHEQLGPPAVETA